MGRYRNLSKKIRDGWQASLLWIGMLFGINNNGYTHYDINNNGYTVFSRV